ncbi:MAG TPA: hypothetical protein ENI80_04450 [Acidiferrobacteraceae bacterium]|nr:hypothetical protein [Acidiferrobacteraceae bacterium]
MLKIISTLVFVTTLPLAGYAQDGLPIFDGHIHYSQSVWRLISPPQAIRLLQQAGIERCLVSSTPNEGSEKLYALSPERIVPFLRPYRTRKDMLSWFNDPATLEYVKKQLDVIPYQGIGEFHLNGTDANTPVMGRIFRLARDKGLALHAHTDEAGIRNILIRAPNQVVIWAHAGFDKVPIATLQELLDDNSKLYLELSFRNDILIDSELNPHWRDLFLDHPYQFILGMDTYIPARWSLLPDYTDDARYWLNMLPEKIAKLIAHGNASRLFPVQANR